MNTAFYGGASEASGGRVRPTVYKSAKVRVYFFVLAAGIQAAGVGEAFFWRISASSRNFFTR